MQLINYIVNFLSKQFTCNIHLLRALFANKGQMLTNALSDGFPPISHFTDSYVFLNKIIIIYLE